MDMKKMARQAYKAGTGEDLLADQRRLSGVRSAFDSKTATILVTVMALVCGLVVAWTLSRPVGVQAVPPPNPPVTNEAVPESGQAPDEPAQLIVYVSGEVNDPGLVELESGARVADAIAERGGITPEADPGAVNMARMVTDGEHIVVPKPGESPPPTSTVAEPAKVNINTADATLLETLNGIGPSLAERIIAHREERGPFTSIDQLLEVSGIGHATLEKFAADLTL